MSSLSHSMAMAEPRRRRRIHAIVGGGGTSSLRFAEIEMPRLKSGYDVLIENRAVSVNVIDCRIRQGLSESSLDVLGLDGAGIVRKVGPNVKHLAVGDEVYYTNEIGHTGSHAQFTAVDSRLAAMKPANLSFEEAAALPMDVVCMWQSLTESMQIQQDCSKTILIVGATTPLGILSAQICKKFGLTVIVAIASSKEKQGLGNVVDHFISDAGELQAQLIGIGFVDGVDFCLNTISANRLSEFVKVLKPRGHICSLGTINKTAWQRIGVDALYLGQISLHWLHQLVRPKQHRTGVMPVYLILEAVRQMMEKRILQSPAIREVSWLDFETAYDLVRSKSVVGKVVMTMNKRGGKKRVLS